MNASLAFAVPIAAFALVAAGIIFERAEQRRDRAQYPQVGRSVDIGGRALNIYCSGEGGPAVIFDTYGQISGYVWSAVQKQIAKFRTAGCTTVRPTGGATRRRCPAPFNRWHPIFTSFCTPPLFLLHMFSSAEATRHCTCVSTTASTRTK